jgi:outer membrane protein assembly factor BamB
MRPSPPLFKDGLIYAGSDKGVVCALNASDGTKLWNSIIGTGSLSAPALYGGVLYFGSSDGNLYALNATNGLELWAYPISSPISLDHSSWDVGGGVGSPLVCDGVLYVGGG